MIPKSFKHFDIINFTKLSLLILISFLIGNFYRIYYIVKWLTNLLNCLTCTIHWSNTLLVCGQQFCWYFPHLPILFPRTSDWFVECPRSMTCYIWLHGKNHGTKPPSTALTWNWRIKRVKKSEAFWLGLKFNFRGRKLKIDVTFDKLIFFVIMQKHSYNKIIILITKIINNITFYYCWDVKRVLSS